MAALFSKCAADCRPLPRICWRFCEVFRKSNLLREFTLPLLSYFRGNLFSSAIRDALDHTIEIEDLWIPFFCVSTNMRKSACTQRFYCPFLFFHSPSFRSRRTDMAVHRSGPLWVQVRASMTVLGLLPPVVFDGEFLVDGGYSNNLPVDVMRQCPSIDTVIASDVEDKDVSMFEGVSPIGDGMSGWVLLWKNFLKLLGLSQEKLPNFASLQLWLQFLNHTRHLKRLISESSIDLYIRPQVSPFSLLDYLKMDEIVKSGYAAAKETLYQVLQHSLAERDETVDAQDVLDVMLPSIPAQPQTPSSLKNRSVLNLAAMIRGSPPSPIRSSRSVPSLQRLVGTGVVPNIQSPANGQLQRHPSMLTLQTASYMHSRSRSRHLSFSEPHDSEEQFSDDDIETIETSEP